MSGSIIPWESRLHPNFKNEILPLFKKQSFEEDITLTCERLLAENNEYYSSVNYLSVIERLQHIDEEIRKRLVNRSEVTQQGLRALMTGEHQFIFSAAGVAKSLYANQIFSFFKNSHTFALQFCPDTTPDDLFGAYDIEKFKKGEIYHNIEGSIITNNFAFLDEFMDGNDKLLRTLLGVLLERKFISGNQVEESILHTAIATSNYMRVSETTEALLDRFLYKSFIKPSKEMFTLLKIDRVYNENSGKVSPPSPESQIEMRELVYIMRMIKGRHPEIKIKIPIEIDYLKNLVAVGFEEEMSKYRENYYLSPRTISKSNDLLKTNALLSGRLVVSEEDVEKLYYLFCTVNEPLNEDQSLLSHELFKKVYQKRLQYFHSIKQELIPLLYIFDFLCEAEIKPEILKNPNDYLHHLVKHSIINDMFDKLKHILVKEEGNFSSLNKQDILDYINAFKSDYLEITSFKRKLEDFCKEVFNKIGL